MNEYIDIGIKIIKNRRCLNNIKKFLFHQWPKP